MPREADEAEQRTHRKLVHADVENATQAQRIEIAKRRVAAMEQTFSGYRTGPRNGKQVKPT